MLEVVPEHKSIFYDDPCLSVMTVKDARKEVSHSRGYWLTHLPEDGFFAIVSHRDPCSDEIDGIAVVNHNVITYLGQYRKAKVYAACWEIVKMLGYHSLETYDDRTPLQSFHGCDEDDIGVWSTVARSMNESDFHDIYRTIEREKKKHVLWDEFITPAMKRGTDLHKEVTHRDDPSAE